MAGTVEQVVSDRRNGDRFTNYELSMDGARAGMAFLFSKYSYEGAQTGFAASNRGFYGLPNASIQLPLPSNINDSYSINVGGNEIGAVGAMGAAVGSGSSVADLYNAALASTEALGEAAGGMLTDRSNIEALTTARAYASFVGRNASTYIPGGADAERGLGVGSGTAVNPHQALVFNGVSLKTHTFDWKLSPKNIQEANTIRDMANRIRKAALPSYQGIGEGLTRRALLEYPDLVQVWFVGVDREYFYKFKPCMIQNFSVNYGPEGVSLNRGGIPSSVTFTMTLIETQIHTKEDY